MKTDEYLEIQFEKIIKEIMSDLKSKGCTKQQASDEFIRLKEMFYRVFIHTFKES